MKKSDKFMITAFILIVGFLIAGGVYLGFKEIKLHTKIAYAYTFMRGLSGFSRENNRLPNSLEEFSIWRAKTIEASAEHLLSVYTNEVELIQSGTALNEMPKYTPVIKFLDPDIQTHQEDLHNYYFGMTGLSRFRKAE